MNVNLTIGIPMWLDFLFAWPVLVYRQWKYGCTFRRIYLGDGNFTILDQQDYYRYAGFRWFARCEKNTFYVYRWLKIPGRRSKLIALHREILNAPKGLFVDHQNCFGFDNRRTNLRLATRSQNNCNKRKRKNTSSRFIGVSIHNHSNRWRAYISYKGKKIYLGYFDDEIDAAKAYDAAAKIYHGEWARLNFPDEDTSCGKPLSRIISRQLSTIACQAVLVLSSLAPVCQKAKNLKLIPTAACPELACGELARPELVEGVEPVEGFSAVSNPCQFVVQINTRSEAQGPFRNRHLSAVRVAELAIGNRQSISSF